MPLLVVLVASAGDTDATAEAAPSTAALLARHAPVLRPDARDGYPATSVDAFLRGAPPRRVDRDAPPVVYGRAVRGTDGRTWLQFWRFSTYNPQDRGILRTGRHEGDWELTQVGLSPAGRPERVTFAQHSWRESCARSQVESRGGHVVVYVANGSHASYAHAGEHGRPWPDPDDEARGDAAAVVPRVVAVTASSPSWMTRRSPWGATRASWVPAESDSPLGPAFQAPWGDPAAFDAGARRCGSGAPPRPFAVTAALALPPLLFLLAAAAVHRRRRRSSG